ncbi:hypothetical protein IE4872_PD01844 (plasmid) [Rhizobium gallicum]|uniref:Uncharacterized protein n=1 Tax=Rhizobium gallicum TaxID=56730 RepID=A0A1L5NWW1_9HYPH|nr:hypothetical protein IE4872_PD01844 [Rhizobium gallicum]
MPVLLTQDEIELFVTALRQTAGCNACSPMSDDAAILTAHWKGWNFSSSSMLLQWMTWRVLLPYASRVI